MAFNLAISLTGSIMVRELDANNIWARFIGYCFCIAYSANFPLVLSISSSNVGGFTKKNTANAMVSPDAGSANIHGTSCASLANKIHQVFIAYCLGNIIGPQLFFEDEAPSYPSGFLSMIICFGAALILSIVLRIYLIWENKRRDKKTGTIVDIADDQVGAMNLSDATDKEMPNFRYVY
jgi:Na+(H+)/acetate symporter ActP